MSNFSLNVRWLLMIVMIFSCLSSIADTIPQLSNSLLIDGWRISNNDTVNKLYPGAIYLVHPKWGGFLVPKSETSVVADNTIEVPPLYPGLLSYQANIRRLSVADTGKWHPETIYIVLPDRKLTFKLPHGKDQDPSGVANLLFQCKETGKIHLHDTVKGGYRSFNVLLMSGKYDAVLLYNNGKYIRYNNVVFEKNADTEVNMEKLDVQASDAISRYWLTLRAFNTPTRERIYHKYYSTVSEKKIRGYLYQWNGNAFWCGAGISAIGTAKKWTWTHHDGYFEFDVDPNQTLKISDIDHITLEIKITENCGLIVWMKGVPIDPDFNPTTGQP